MHCGHLKIEYNLFSQLVSGHCECFSFSVLEGTSKVSQDILQGKNLNVAIPYLSATSSIGRKLQMASL